MLQSDMNRISSNTVAVSLALTARNKHPTFPSWRPPFTPLSIAPGDVTQLHAVSPRRLLQFLALLFLWTRLPFEYNHTAVLELVHRVSLALRTFRSDTTVRWSWCWCCLHMVGWQSWYTTLAPIVGTWHKQLDRNLPVWGSADCYWYGATYTLQVPNIPWDGNVYAVFEN